MKTETTWQLITDDCLNALPTIEESSIDACVTDPPYGLEFMGQNWDYGIPGVAYWKEVLRVLKPGAPLLAFGGTRTHHRLMTAIEDAGFELKDCCVWLYGSGFPKSLNISKAIDKAAGVERKVVGPATHIHSRGKNTAWPKRVGETTVEESGRSAHQDCPVITAPATAEAKLWDGWGSALKPAYEPIILAMKPLDGTYAHNALTHGVAGFNIDGCRIPTDENLNGGAYAKESKKDMSDRHTVTLGATGKMFIQPTKRWPTNVILDEEAGKLLDEQTGERPGMPLTTKRKGDAIKGYMRGWGNDPGPNGYGDNGGASRFFYCAKTSRSERTHKGTIDNPHPTVKPLALMQWLCRLVSTPTGGTILDPFAGSGSTGIAAMKEGLNFVGIEKEEAYAEIARKRLAAAQPVPRRRQASLFDLIGGLD